jgi:hypothetical protein
MTLLEDILIEKVLINLTTVVGSGTQNMRIAVFRADGRFWPTGRPLIDWVQSGTFTTGVKTYDLTKAPVILQRGAYVVAIACDTNAVLARDFQGFGSRWLDPGMGTSPMKRTYNATSTTYPTSGWPDPMPGPDSINENTGGGNLADTFVMFQWSRVMYDAAPGLDPSNNGWRQSFWTPTPGDWDNLR